MPYQALYNQLTQEPTPEGDARLKEGVKRGAIAAHFGVPLGPAPQDPTVHNIALSTMRLLQAKRMQLPDHENLPRRAQDTFHTLMDTLRVHVQGALARAIAGAQHYDPPDDMQYE